MIEEEILFEVEDRVAVVKLNRPKSLNALNENMRQRLDDIFKEVNDRDDIRVVTIFGEGRAFCAGQDLKEGSLNYNSVQYLEKKQLVDFQRRLQCLTKPSIVGLHGYVLGRGLEFALSADIRIAADNAQFSLPEVKLGMLPASGGTQLLTRLIGEERAMYIIMTSEKIDAREAERWGMVTRVVPLENLRSSVIAAAQMIAEGAPLAVHYAKKTIRQAQRLSLEDGLQMESVLQAILMSTEDRAEGLKAFREGRKPKYSNR